MNKDGIIYTIVFTFLGTFVFVFLLSLANQQTKPMVEANQKNAFYTAILRAANLYEEEADPQQLFEDYFPGADIEEDQSFITQVRGVEIRVYPFSGSGLWGTVNGVLAVNRRVDRIVGLELISHSETPGLGGRIDEDWFKDQFRDEFIPAAGIQVNKGTGGADTDNENGQVDGITGASLTSQSIEVMVNQTIETIRQEGGN